jgi:ribosomal protein S18 acetylase RimI-like enzyme
VSPVEPVRVRPAREADLPEIAAIGSESFSGLRPLEEGTRWVRACWAAQPRMQYWVAERLDRPIAYILWVEKGGFRREAVVELEQIAVGSTLRGRGVGGTLVKESLDQLRQGIEREGRRIKIIEVTTGSEQGAIDFYRRTLGAEVVAKIPDFFRGDEYLLVARPTPTSPA